MATDSHRPTHKDIDVYGLTHQGLVRKRNEDHFFTGSLSSGVMVDCTSIPSDADQILELERFASLAMVADGVGSTGGGEEAARIAVQAIRQHVARGFREAYAAETTDSEAFDRLLSDAALACHEKLLERAKADPEHTRYATTLTLFLGLWPHAYLLQVGDSRCYMYRDNELIQISRDQTMAQELVDQGILTRSDADNSRWAHVLSSAIGGQQTAPVVTRFRQSWRSVGLLCSDGLTKHVSDDQIRERLSTMTSAKQVCEDLLQDALDGGGTDNITIIVGRALRKD